MPAITIRRAERHGGLHFEGSCKKGPRLAVPTAMSDRTEGCGWRGDGQEPRLFADSRCGVVHGRMGGRQARVNRSSHGSELA